MIFAGIPFEREHDLDLLAGMLPAGCRARNSVGRLSALTEYAVDTRYPDARSEPTRQDAEQAVKTATAVLRMVIRDLGERGLPLRTPSRRPEKLDKAPDRQAPQGHDDPGH